MSAKTPIPPYYAVIFTSEQSADKEGYSEMSEQMVKLAEKQPGFLGIETARSNIRITVSYWKDLESIKDWKENTLHAKAQQLGKDKWYKNYKVRICKVERDYGFEKSSE